MPSEQDLLTQLDAIVKKLEADQDTQCIPLETLTALETEAQRLHDALLKLYQGLRVSSQDAPQQASHMEE
jgi:hypothetical protein